MDSVRLRLTLALVQDSRSQRVARGLKPIIGGKCIGCHCLKTETQMNLITTGELITIGATSLHHKKCFNQGPCNPIHIMCGANTSCDTRAQLETNGRKLYKHACGCESTTIDVSFPDPPPAPTPTPSPRKARYGHLPLALECAIKMHLLSLAFCWYHDRLHLYCCTARASLYVWE
jgi:hypothetical protein